MIYHFIPKYMLVRQFPFTGGPMLFLSLMLCCGLALLCIHLLWLVKYFSVFCLFLVILVYFVSLNPACFTFSIPSILF